MNTDGTHQPAGLVERLTNVFVAPGELFRGVAPAPVAHANWIAPLIIYVVASWIVAGLMLSSESLQQEMRELQRAAMLKTFQPMLDKGTMTQAQVDQSIEQSAGIMKTFQAAGAVVSPLLTAAVLPFWGGLVIWVGGLLVFREKIEFMKAVEVAGLTMPIAALGVLVVGLVSVARGSMFAGVGLGMLVPHFDFTNQFHTALARVELFGLWVLAVRSFGLAELAKTSRLKAAAWLFGVWAALTGLMLAFFWALQFLMSSLSAGK